MPRRLSLSPKLRITAHPRTPYCVVYADPAQREKSGRAKRIPKWFSDRAEAERYLEELKTRLGAVGAVGLAMDEETRADYWAARQRLDFAGFRGVSLRQLAEEHVNRTPSPQGSRLLLTALDEFIEFKRRVEGATQATTDNLEDRLRAWFYRASLTHIDQVTIEAIKELRARAGVSAATRKNDMAAASSFASWLVENGELKQNPVMGMRRPRVQRARPTILTNKEVAALLKEMAGRAGGRFLPCVVLMLAGLRPSEIPHARIIYTGQPCVRLEGDAGKLRGRANRIVRLWPAAVKWLELVGKPTGPVRILNHTLRQKVCRELGIQWKADICRHTAISHLSAIEEHEGKVARESGTSPDIVFSHYHRLVTKAEAKAFRAIAPGKDTG